MGDKSYVGDIGTLIIVRTGTDLTGASAAIKVKIARLGNPSMQETFATWSATVKNPNVNGILEYIVQQGDFALSGDYSIAADVTFEDGSHYTGDTATFTVYDVFS